MNPAPSLHSDLAQLVREAHHAVTVDDLQVLLARHQPPPEIWRTEYAVRMNRNGAIWNKYQTEEAAREFVESFPDIDMTAVTRQAAQERHTDWTKL